MSIRMTSNSISDFEAYHRNLKAHCCSESPILEFIFVVCIMMKVSSRESQLILKFIVRLLCLKCVDPGAYSAFSL